MTTKQIELNGSLVITNSGTNTKPVALGVGSTTTRTYEQVLTDQDEISTTGGVTGGVFQDLACVSQLSEILFLYIKSDNSIIVRLYAVPASALATSGTYPTGFVGGETLITTIDGVAVTTTFTNGAQTLDQVVNEINASMALNGIASPRAVASNGQLLINGVSTAVGASGDGQLSFAGTGAAQLGMDAGSSPTITDAQGQDVAKAGLYLDEFPSSGSLAPTAVQISGTATIDVVAAGRS